MRTRLLFWLSLWLAMTGPVYAQSSQTEKPFRAYDEGQISCGHYTEVRASKQKLGTDIRAVQAEEWASGFVTAYNMYVHPSGDILGSPDLDGAYLWLDGYCQHHPTALFMEAITALVNDLGRK